MASSLKRLLRIRTIEEDLARTALEAETVRLRELERLAGAAAGDALASRERWFAAVGRESAEETSRESANAAGRERLAEESAWDVAVWRRGRVEARQPAQQAEVERVQAEYLSRRCERMQLESLVAAAKSLERRSEARGEQGRLDDWFRSRSNRKRCSTERLSMQAARDEHGCEGPPF